MGRELCINMGTISHPQSYSYQEGILLSVSKRLSIFIRNIQTYN